MQKEFAEALAETGWVELRESYSGRGMYGNATAAVTFDSLKDLFSAIAEVAYSHGYDEASEELKTHTWDIITCARKINLDSMGLGQIAY